MKCTPQGTRPHTAEEFAELQRAIAGLAPTATDAELAAAHVAAVKKNETGKIVSIRDAIRAKKLVELADEAAALDLAELDGANTTEKLDAVATKWGVK